MTNKKPRQERQFRIRGINFLNNNSFNNKNMTKVDINLIQNKPLKEDSPLEGNQESKVLTAKDCPQFESCSAPLCPLDLIDNAAWSPDEEICAGHNYSTLPWVRRQRKIARKVRNKDYFFTIDMLNQNCTLTVATEGIDPDANLAATKTLVKTWLKKHPEKKAKTKEDIELLRNRMVGIRKGLNTKKNDQSAGAIGKRDANPLGLSEASLSWQYQSATCGVKVLSCTANSQ